jgi:hypothetical protein
MLIRRIFVHITLRSKALCDATAIACKLPQQTFLGASGVRIPGHSGSGKLVAAAHVSALATARLLYCGSWLVEKKIAFPPLPEPLTHYFRHICPRWEYDGCHRREAAELCWTSFPPHVVDCGAHTSSFAVPLVAFAGCLRTNCYGGTDMRA